MSEGVGRTWTFYMENSVMSDDLNPRIAREHRTKVLLVNLRETSVLSWAFLFPPKRKRTASASATQQR